MTLNVKQKVYLSLKELGNSHAKNPCGTWELHFRVSWLLPNFVIFWAPQRSAAMTASRGFPPLQDSFSSLCKIGTFSEPFFLNFVSIWRVSLNHRKILCGRHQSLFRVSWSLQNFVSCGALGFARGSPPCSDFLILGKIGTFSEPFFLIFVYFLD